MELSVFEPLMARSRRRFLRAFTVCFLFVVSFLNISCSHDQDLSGLTSYFALTQSNVCVEYGFYKCSYAHYRDGVPVSGFEDIFKVKAGTVISYDSHRHVIKANEVFDANDWFLDNQD